MRDELMPLRHPEALVLLKAVRRLAGPRFELSPPAPFLRHGRNLSIPHAQHLLAAQPSIRDRLSELGVDPDNSAPGLHKLSVRAGETHLISHAFGPEMDRIIHRVNSLLDIGKFDVLAVQSGIQRIRRYLDWASSEMHRDVSLPSHRRESGFRTGVDAALPTCRDHLAELELAIDNLPGRIRGRLAARQGRVRTEVFRERAHIELIAEETTVDSVRADDELKEAHALLKPQNRGVNGSSLDHQADAALVDLYLAWSRVWAGQGIDEKEAAALESVKSISYAPDAIDEISAFVLRASEEIVPLRRTARRATVSTEVFLPL